MLSLLLHGLLLLALPPTPRLSGESLRLHATFVLSPPLQAAAPSPELTLSEATPPEAFSQPGAEMSPAAFSPNQPEASVPVSVKAQDMPSRPHPQRSPPANKQQELLYPLAAIAQGLEGEAWVLLIFDEQGRVSKVSLAQSSGHALLDRAALRAARQLHWPDAAVSELILPVRFRLE